MYLANQNLHKEQNMFETQVSLPSINNELEQVLTPILTTLDTATNESKELLLLINAQNFEPALTKISSLLQQITEIELAQKPILPQLEFAYTVEMLDNLRDVLERIQLALTTTQQETNEQVVNQAFNQALFLSEFQLIPMFRNTKESFYFWGRIDKNPELLKRYYAEEFSQRFHNPYVASGLTLPYQVSIVVVAFNELQHTKRCVESILENTDFESLQAELILVDHGSSDGTLEYFESIPNAKVVHFKHNTMVAMFPILPQICRSPFYVHVANDTAATKDWLDILLACMKSDPKIATAAPATCNISNYQSVNVPTKDYFSLIELAQKHNKVNPLFWNERAQIYPPIGIFNITILNQIGFWDPAIYSFFGCDDDFCLRARRAGFKMILCEDVICYHKSHVTIIKQIRENKENREIFKQSSDLFEKKNQIAINSIGSMYNSLILKALEREFQNNHLFQNQILQNNNKLSLLLLEGGIGDTALQLKNMLKRMGKQLDIYHLQTTTKYVDDIKHMSTDYACTSDKNLCQMLEESFPDVRFSFICIENDILNKHPEEDLELNIFTTKFIEVLSNRLQDGGIFAFSLTNKMYFQNVQQIQEFISNNKPLVEWSSISYQAINSLVAMLSQHLKITQIGHTPTDKFNINSLLKPISQTYGSTNLDMYRSLFVNKYHFVCQKQG